MNPKYPLVALLCLTSSLALAYRDHPVESTYDDAEYGRVLMAQPIYETVEYRLPREQCRNEAGPEAAPDQEPGRPFYRPVAYGAGRACHAFADRASRAEVVAYLVRYRYRGHDYVTEMSYDPGLRLSLDADVHSIRW